MLYSLLKIPAKFALWIYCRRLSVNKKAFLKSDGPLLIACNHPNSFLDAIIISTIFKRPVYSLARGDAFANKFYNRLLRSMNMFPVYRVSEGVENLEENYKTFDDCKELFKKNGVVLIFSEGKCINEWHLRPLRKGTARLAISAWKEGIPLKILPTGLNYSSFYSFGKNVQLNFGDIITKQNNHFNDADADGKSILQFNQQLQQQLQGLVEEIKPADQKVIKEKFAVPVSLFKKVILFIPAVIGYISSFPLFYPIKKITVKKASDNDHYDSVSVGLLFILYPLYLLLLTLPVYIFIGGWWWAAVFIVLPFCARCYVQIKEQF